MVASVLSEAAVDVLDTMEGRPYGTRWTEVQIQEDTGRAEEEVRTCLHALEEAGRVRWQEVPFARAGWYLVKGGGRWAVGGGQNLKSRARIPKPRTPSPEPRAPSLEERLSQIEAWVRPRSPPNLATSKAVLPTALRIILELVSEVRRLNEDGSG